MSKPKKRAQKPVRAWADREAMAEYVAENYVGFKVCAWKRRDSDIPVRVVPDGAPSAESETRKLRALLRKVRAHCVVGAAQVPIEDPVARRAVEAACEVFPMAYGALMSQVSLMWRERLAARGDPVGGEHATGCCRATAEAMLREIDAALRRGRR